jgi:predicted secreted Zn-dependent protease
MMVRTLAVGACLLVLPVVAVSKDSFRVEYFDIHGATARELRADLTRLGPVGETGIPGDAYTEYRIAWRFSMRFKNGVCRAEDVVVDLDVTMRLPRWSPPAGVAAQLIETWDRFNEVLREHEDGHHEIAIAAAREVRHKLRARARAASCEALKNKLNTAAGEVLGKYRNRQRDYDRETDFGRAQGARLL